MVESARAWSREEVEATVAAYFDMLLMELARQPFNKAERRRDLQRLLDRRTEGAIERKHQNISAVLIELGFPYVDGYKPLGNYQGLLAEVVEDRIAAMPALAAAVAAEVAQPAPVPSVDDILSILVEPPPAPEARYPTTTPTVRERKRQPPPRAVNYLELEAANAMLGRAGEQFVVNFERARLIAEGHERLASSVDHIAATTDAAGFDILSFEADGRDRLIEVKTTAFGVFTPFFVTRNELDVSMEQSERYHVYRLFTFRKDPRMFVRSGRMDQSFRLDPRVYTAKVV